MFCSIFIQGIRDIICQFINLSDLHSLSVTNSTLSTIFTDIDLSRYTESIIKHRKLALIKSEPNCSHLFYSLKWNYWTYTLHILQTKVVSHVPIIIDCLNLHSLKDTALEIISDLFENYQISRFTIETVYKISLMRNLDLALINSFRALYNLDRLDPLLLRTLSLRNNTIYSNIPKIEYDLLRRLFFKSSKREIYSFLQYEYIREIALSSKEFACDYPFHYRAAVSNMHTYSFNTLLLS